MKTQALKGMRDLLPAEQTLRDYIQGKILETYRASGFERRMKALLKLSITEKTFTEPRHRVFWAFRRRKSLRLTEAGQKP